MSKSVKKFIRAFCCLALLLSLLPAVPAMAAATMRTTTLDLSANPSNQSSAAEGWAWAQHTKTLTLTDVNIVPASGMGIKLPADATIVLAGSNTVKGSFGIEARNLTIEGAGSLNIAPTSAVGIYAVSYHVTINSGTVTTTGGSGSYNYSYGIWAKNVTINGGTVTATGGSINDGGNTGSFGISAEGGTLAINGGVVIANSGNSVVASRAFYNAPVLANVTLTSGSWNSKSVRYDGVASTVSFHANSGTGGQTGNVTAKYGLPMPVIAATMPTRTGYTFAGYYDTNEATGGTQYYTFAGASARAWNKTAAATLYARWTINQCTLTVDPSGGIWNGATNEQSHIQDYNSTMTIEAPTRNGYVFGGWVHSGGGSFAEGVYTFAVSSGTLTAQWKPQKQTVVNDETAAGNGFSIVDQSNLDTVLERVIKPADTEGDSIVTLSLNVSDISGESSEMAAIKAAADNGSEVYFFDVSLVKMVSGSEPETLTNIPIPLEIHIKLTDDLADKSYYKVYRYHNGVAEQISNDTSKTEHYVVDVAASEIIIYTMKFSTYAIFGNDYTLDFDEGYDVDVQAKITGDGSGVYKIDIAWGAMTFVYSTSGVWNPNTHAYTEGATVGWLQEGFMYDNNKITAWNHSNGDVLVSFAVTKNLLSGTSMAVKQNNSFDDNTEAVNVPLGRVPQENAPAPSIDAFLWLDGEPNNPSALDAIAYTKIAVITVTIKADGEERTLPSH